jgi:hypothetical protein
VPFLRAHNVDRMVLWTYQSPSDARVMRVNSAIELENGDEGELLKFSARSFVCLGTRVGWGVAVGMLVLAMAPLSVSRPGTIQGSAPGNPSANSLRRPCKNTAIGSKPSKGSTKNGKKALGDAGTDPAAACLEVRSTALDVQEFLQAYGREQKWNLIDEQVGEDAWTFSRKLEKDELLRFTKKEANSSGVDWTSGVSFVQVRTAQLEDGFVRVQVSARFKGYGQNPDQFAPPKESWTLSSNTSFENLLISVLQTHFKNAS